MRDKLDDLIDKLNSILEQYEVGLITEEELYNESIVFVSEWLEQTVKDHLKPDAKPN